MQKHTAESIAHSFTHTANVTDQALHLDLGDCAIRCQSNSPELLAVLARYFKAFITTHTSADIEILLLESEAQTVNEEFTDWAREPGKTGRKDSFVELTDGRLILKVRTGMLFLQSVQHRIAIGPCVKNDNQVINFINAQYMNWLQQRDWLICHSAAAQLDQQGVAICGFSGGGKSTLMLHLLSQTHAKFVSNDRLFLKAKNGEVHATGVAKLPRINPGTALNNPDLEGIIDVDKAQQVRQMPINELWDLEDKYDVDIEAVYGRDRIQLHTPLNLLVILNWDRNSSEPTQLSPVDIHQRPDLLPAVMKSPGPFFQDSHGQFLQQPATPAEQRYIELLSNVMVVEARGGIDFSQATQHIIALLGHKG